MHRACLKGSRSERKVANITYFLRDDIKLKKGRFGFNLVTDVISKQSFFIIASGILRKFNHINME